MQDNNRNMILAVVLSMLVLFGWQYFVAGPQMEKAAKQAQTTQQTASDTQTAGTESGTGASAAAPDANLATPNTATGSAQAPTTEASAETQFDSVAKAIASGNRVKIDTPLVSGSLNLVGAKLDDLELKSYHETVDKTSPIVRLLSPTGAPDAYFAEQGWVNAGGDAKLPGPQTLWTAAGDQDLTPEHPVTLTWTNGEGLVFSRTFAVDDQYLFTVTQSVKNTSGKPVALYPYARIVRHGAPQVQNTFILHEGMIGVLGSANLIQKSYGDLEKDKQIDQTSTGGWLGFTGKYFSSAVLPDPKTAINARFSWSKSGTTDAFQASYVGSDPVTVGADATSDVKSYVFAGAKVESILDSYQKKYGFDRLDLLIDWGWFYFLTKPMFYLIRFLHGLLGNFGLAILAVTVIVKAIFFPLASRSYASMAKMRNVQPQMKEIQERFKDDRQAQQQAIMELYQREKVNPLAGCWPIVIQIPVFYSLYTVLYVTIEMRHAPFFGWIRDLASPDPTNIFTLFGLIPWDPTLMPLFGHFLHLGIWPLIMGVTMWVQMKLNPPPPDPAQAMIFNFMPIIFTFMLGSFPAGLVIYWAWNNTLSVTQQYIIMKRHGAEVHLFSNILSAVGLRKPAPDKTGK